MLTQTATVGQAVLRAAIRLQNPHIRYEDTTVLDREQSGCYDCIRSLSCPSACDNCPSRVFRTEQKKVYVNERARFGERRTLNRNALFLFLWLHFHNPDENGLVRMIDAEEAAEELHCHVRTVINNLVLLEEAGYIACRKLPITHYYDIFLSEYSTYFQTASRGGRGYLLLSQELFRHVLEQPTLNGVRLALRGIISSVDDVRRKGFIAEKSYQEIKLDLPDYCTKKEIRKTAANDAFRKVFRTLEKKRTLTITIREEFDQSSVRELFRSDAEAAIKIQLDRINGDTVSAFSMAAEGSETGVRFSSPADEKSPKKTVTASKAIGTDTALSSAPRFELTARQLSDISGIALKYPVWCITKALDQIYHRYLRFGLEIQNLAALVRTFARQNAELALAA